MDNPENPGYLWQVALDEAIRELNPGKLAARLAAADDSLFYRLFEIEGTIGNDDERLALEDAMEDIRILRNHAFPSRT